MPGTIEAVGTALTGFFKLIQPSIDEKYSQLYANQHKERMENFESIIREADSAARGAALGKFIGELFVTSGEPAGSIPYELTISIPVSHFRTLVKRSSEAIRDEQMIGKLEFKQGQ